MNKRTKYLSGQAEADADWILREFSHLSEKERLICAWSAAYGRGVQFVDEMLYDHNQKLTEVIKKEIKDVGDIA